MRNFLSSSLTRPRASVAMALLLCNIAVSSLAQTPCEWSNTMPTTIAPTAPAQESK